MHDIYNTHIYTMYGIYDNAGCFRIKVN